MHGHGGIFALVPLGPLPRWRGGLFRFGTTRSPAAVLARGPPARLGLLCFGTTEAPPHWRGGLLSRPDHRCPHRMGAGASFVFRTPRSPPHRRGGLCAFGSSRPLLHGHGGIFALVPLGPLPRWRGGLFRFGTTRSPAAVLARGPPARLGLLCFGTTEAPPHWRGGLLSRPDHRCPHRMGAGASFVFKTPRSPPHRRGGLLCVWIIEAPAARVWAPSLLRHHRGPHCMGGGASTGGDDSAGGDDETRVPHDCPGPCHLHGCHWSPCPVFVRALWLAACLARAMILACSNLGTFPAGKLPTESVSWSAHGHLWQECCAAGVGIRLRTKPP